MYFLEQFWLTCLLFDFVLEWILRNITPEGSFHRRGSTLRGGGGSPLIIVAEEEHHPPTNHTQKYALSLVCTYVWGWWGGEWLRFLFWCFFLAKNQK